ncbi:hypothetical protein H9Q74_014449 [Fusarium xylarioides]|nr:hypothetical protein H9Q74_014449 [Fusarium xylarioides]
MTGTDNTNPGNFANRPKEEVQEIASKGGKSSHSGGFASMDADKHVVKLVLSALPAEIPLPHGTIASRGHPKS